jgi:carbamoylphosphate synthase large subunit
MLARRPRTGRRHIRHNPDQVKKQSENLSLPGLARQRRGLGGLGRAELFVDASPVQKL